jgi:predicted RNase H-like HicB family nuclease
VKSAQARPQEHPVKRGSLADSEEVRRERYLRLAALIREWEADPTGHDEELWPLIAELDGSNSAASRWAILGRGGSPMKFKVALRQSEEGYSVSVPGLPGCVSQGETEEEALANIKDAIQEYLEVAEELLQEAELVREVEVAV